MPNRTFIDKAVMKFNGYFGPLPEPEKWIFIVGCYNSGTTLLHDLISIHPEIGSMPDEGQFFTDQFLLPQECGLPRLWALDAQKFCMDENDISGPDPKKLKRQWGAKYKSYKESILVEKSPTNTGRMRWLQSNFKNAYFVGIVRNGFAVAEGIRRKANHNIKKASQQWKISNEIMLNDFKYINNKKVILYEDLTEETSRVYDEIIDFIGITRAEIDVENLKLSVHERLAKVKNMNAYSFNNLSITDKKIIENTCGSLLERYDYSCDD